MTRKIRVTYKGNKQQPQQRSGYAGYWPDDAGPDRPKKRQVNDSDVPIVTRLLRGAYALEFRATELADQPEWQRECLEDAAALKALRASLLEAAGKKQGA